MPDISQLRPSGVEDMADATRAERSGERSGELARAQARNRFLERQCDFLTRHARNMELEVRRLRRHRRESAVELRRVEPDEGFWRRRYEEVVNSWSWRFMWWLGTPYRAWVRFQTGRQRR